MAALPYMQLYVADYLADTAHLTAAQHGAYLLLIFNYWQRGKPLNNANERLTNVARMTNEEWEIAKPVLKEFFEIDGDEWKHHRIERDLEAVNTKAAKASAAGKASAASKANKRSTNVKQTFNHTDTDTDTDSKPSVESKKITFDGSNFQNINGHMAVWKKAYPAIDIEIELQKAAAWLVSNPNNRKSQYGRFLNGWLTRAQDRAPRVGSSSTSSSLFDGVVGYEQN